ncbi:amidohydrolase family protein [Kribbella sp. WER1]
MSQDQPTVFRDVRVLDVRRGRVGEAEQVLVRDGVVDQISPSVEVPDGARVIAGDGRVVMPGLIDAHWHSLFAAVPLMTAMMGDVGYLHIVAAAAARETLMRGFTTVRDAGGPSLGLKQAIDTGVAQGPRIYPSGAMISQTGGHGDFRTRNEVPRGRTGHLSHAELVGAVRIADGVSAVFEAAREQLMLGASQLKLMAGGGVASPYDPLDVTQYTEAELHAAVEAAENWGTYVMVHAYTPRAVQQSVRAGVRCIEHGQLLDDETVALMAENDVWWSLQPFLADEDAPPVPPANQAKYDQMVRGTETAYELARKHEVRLAWGTDTLFDPGLAAKQGKQLAKMTRWFTPAEVLTMATVTNAELLALAAERNPYPGTLGVIEPGAHADLLLVNGNPLDNIQLLATPETSFALIMKQGAIAKNTTS